MACYEIELVKIVSIENTKHYSINETFLMSAMIFNMAYHLHIHLSYIIFIVFFYSFSNTSQQKKNLI